MNDSPHIAVILNPTASGGYDAARIDRLRAIVGSRAVLFSIDEPERVHAVVEWFRERQGATVAIIGGDGTAALVLTALSRAYGKQGWPRIALLRGGTMNTVAYAFGIAKNHPFLDGNKRTAAVVFETFLEVNGHVLAASDEELYPAMVQLAEGSLSEESLAAWLRERLQQD